MYKLYYYPNNASLAPHFLLHHMDVDYELILVDRKSNSQKSAEYLSLNPAGRIPTLVDDNQAIFESSAICIHLCEKHPNHQLIPAVGTKERPLFFQWLAYLNNTFQAELMIRIYPQKHTTDQDAAPSIITAQDQRLRDVLTIINHAIANKPYLLGNQITACDYFLFMLSNWAMSIDGSPLAFIDLAEYLKRLSSLPTIQAVCEIENLSLAAFE